MGFTEIAIKCLTFLASTLAYTTMIKGQDESMQPSIPSNTSFQVCFCIVQVCNILFRTLDGGRVVAMNSLVSFSEHQHVHAGDMHGTCMYMYAGTVGCNTHTHIHTYTHTHAHTHTHTHTPSSHPPVSSWPSRHQL